MKLVFRAVPEVPGNEHGEVVGTRAEDGSGGVW